MARVEDAELARLTAEIDDDVAQMSHLVSEIEARTEALATPNPSDELLAFVALNLHRWYSAAEAAFERIERTLVGPPTSNPTWHAELLRLMTLDIENARPPILRAEVAHRLGPYLRFRHFLRHAYAVRLERDALQPLVSGLRAAHDEVAHDLSAFVAGVRADLHR